MAKVPDPEPGLVCRYGYLWRSQHLSGRVDAVKDRPACIIARVGEGAAATLKSADKQSLRAGDVILLPITTKRPAADNFFVELTPSDKRACGLDPDEPSWVVVSEFNADIWPNADLSLVPGRNEFAYGKAPPGLMARISRRFIEAIRAKTLYGIRR